MRMIVIRNGLVLRRADLPAEAADLLIEDGKILRIGPAQMEAPDDAIVLDASNRLIHPGLICCHTHGNCTFGKGQVDRVTLELLQTAGPWLGTTGSGFDHQVRHLVTYIGALEMLLKGCTACYDMNAELPVPTAEGLHAIGSAYRDAGMRAVIAPMLAEKTLYEAVPGLLDALPEGLRREVAAIRLAPGEASLNGMRQAIAAWNFDADFLRLGMAPTIPHHCSDPFIQNAVRLAREHGLMIQSHISESRTQAVASRSIYGETQIAHLDRLGVLGPDFIGGHGVWLDRDDMKRLADRGAAISVNAGSNMRLGNGMPDPRAMFDAGIRIGLGTDGAHCSDNLNMYQAMRAANLCSRVQSLDTAQWLSAEETFHAATKGGASLLGMDDQIGELSEGYQADLVMLRLDHVNWMPLNQPLYQLVHVEDATSIDKVMVGGRLVVDDGRPVGVDLQALMDQVEEVRERLAGLNQPARELAEQLSVYVNQFCPAYASAPYPVQRLCCGTG